MNTKDVKAFLILFAVVALNSCEATHHKTVSTPVRRSAPAISNTGTRTTPANQTEIEYQTLSKTYKSETAAVLTDILNGSADQDKTSVTVENKSRCNMVLTISGNNYFKKVPIAAGKIGAVMVPKNQNYNLSGMVCNAVYQKTKFVSGPHRTAVSN
ncbi:hypothetical protein QE422_000870 [Chryseobacterium sp. SORGH_AS 447]|uniref:DUF6759 domain-containing protein n=1 Tax=Chryseobacterium sp. SORGH_AS_0447 TaxID=3041769 RepID=UPI002782CCEA|nr:DUF6759 domain-containing protein [Chryseobacterium sp. SORGH_AS_0447]MDQ1160502.1 hypothetical protein [Chryseobacterium sp. SORGH_AS_0447]